MQSDNYSNYFDNLIKQSKSEKKQVAIYIDELTLERMDTITYQLGLTRNKLVEDAITMYLTEAERRLSDTLDVNATPQSSMPVAKIKPVVKSPVLKSVVQAGKKSSTLLDKVKSAKSVYDLIDIYEKQAMPMDIRREAHKDDKRNDVPFFALTETRVIHDNDVPSDWSGLSGASQAYYMPEHGDYIARGGKDTLRKHANVLKTLNGKTFNPKEVPLEFAKLAVSDD